MGMRYMGGDLEEELTRNFRRDSGGLWTCEQGYFCRVERFPEVIPKARSQHPEFPFLYLDEIVSCNRAAGGYYLINCKYAGALNAGEGGGGDGGGEVENPPEFSLDITLSDEPLVVHERYDALSEKQKSEAVEMALNPPRGADETTLRSINTQNWPTLQKQLYENYRKGFEQFRDVKAIFSKRYVSNLRPADLNKVGEIDNPPEAPAVRAGRDWLSLGLRYTQIGQTYSIEESWELSGRGGWDEDHY